MKVARSLLAALVVGALALRGADAWAQRRPDNTPLENGQEINLAVGESRTISAKDVKNYSEGVTGIIDIKLTSDNSQFVINGRRPGSTTLLLIKSDGSQVTLNINIFLRSPQVVEKEIAQLIGNIPGVQLRRVGARFVLDGTVASETDLRRVQRIAALYPDQVESLVQGAGAPPPAAAIPTGPEKLYLIRIDLYFIQYDKNSSYAVGITWPGSFGGPALQAQISYDFLLGTTRSATASLANQPLPQLDLAARRGWAKVLKQATVITNNDAEASFTNGGEQNFPINTGLTVGVGRIPFGTDLTVLPHYESSRRELGVKLTADISDLTAPVGSSLPGRSTSKLSTRVTLKLGQSLILSGIRTQSLAHTVAGLPVLSDIPVIGLLFGSHAQSEVQTEGAIFVVPTVIESVPSSGAELVDYALQKFKAYDGEIGNVNTYDKRPGGGVGVPR